jgi:hypothetical protein
LVTLANVEDHKLVAREKEKKRKERKRRRKKFVFKSALFAVSELSQSYLSFKKCLAVFRKRKFNV